MLYFGFQAFQFVIPGNRLDAYMKGGITIEPIFAPPFYHFEVENKFFTEKFVNLGAREKVKNEEGIFTFQSDPEILKNLTAYDPITKKEVKKKFEPGEVVKIIIGQMSDQINLPIEPD